MKGHFDACLVHILKSEGGYVNNPRDPGGETNMGISRRTYPKEDIRGMTRARAAQIYRRDYWAPMRCDDLPSGVDLVAFDAAVNSGVPRSSRWLQAAVGVVQDGRIGPITINAARAEDPAKTIVRACSLRMDFLRGVKTWDTFGKGWKTRVERVEHDALAMAGVGIRPDVEPAEAAVEQPPVASTGTKAVAGGAGAVVAGGAAAVAYPEWAPLIAIATIVVATLLVILINRSKR